MYFFCYVYKEHSMTTLQIVCVLVRLRGAVTNEMLLRSRASVADSSEYGHIIEFQTNWTFSLSAILNTV